MVKGAHASLKRHEGALCHNGREKGSGQPPPLRRVARSSPCAQEITRTIAVIALKSSRVSVGRLDERELAPFSSCALAQRQATIQPLGSAPPRMSCHAMAESSFLHLAWLHFDGILQCL